MKPDNQSYWQGDDHQSDNTTAQTPEVAPAPVQPQAPSPQAEAQPETPPAPAAPDAAPDPDQPAASNFAGQGLTTPPEPAPQPTETIHWEASEYIHHDKSPLWLVGFIVVVVLALGVTIWLQNWTFAALIVAMAAAMGMYAYRKPHQIRYSLNSTNLTIDEKAYHLNEFRAFGVVPDGGLYTIRLIPLKRFLPSVTIYFAQDDGEKIVDTLGHSLPMEQMQPDAIDKLMRKIRF